MDTEPSSGGAPCQETPPDDKNNSSNYAADGVDVKPDVKGPLRQVIEDAAEDFECSMADLTVLANQNDPYRFDSPAHHRDARWFKEQIDKRAGYSKIHLRGLHYKICAAGDVLKPNGKPYINSAEDWQWLQEKAADAARWLGYVPFNRIIDQRNEAPRLYIPEEYESGSDWYYGERATIPDSVDSVMPGLECRLYARHPYRIIFFGEKTSLEAILRPVAEAVRGELLLPTGEASDTMIAELAERIYHDDRPSIVLYFSDFDPSGRQMAVSVSRKLQALNDLLYNRFMQVQLYHVGLTLEQVRLYGLPSTPLKESERRADRWRAIMGHEQTEIDAMIALHPQELRQIAKDACRPFFDPDYEDAVKEAEQNWNEEAQELIEEDPAYKQCRTDLGTALKSLQEADAWFRYVQEDVQERLEQNIDLPGPETPEPDTDSYSAASPLFDSEEEFYYATDRLKDYKNYADVRLKARE